MIFSTFRVNFLPVASVCVSLGTMHVVNRSMVRLRLRMAHTDAQFDMLMSANEELNRLIVTYLENR
jgi:hypothetical protein